MRLFLAVELPPPVVDALDTAIAPLRAEAPEIAWSPAAKWHLTMKFLGDVVEERVPEIGAMAEFVARVHRPFAMQLHGIGAFPNFRRARVVWIGVEQEPRLELLHHDLELAAEAEGFDVEGRAFRPHVTLARVQEPLELEVARRVARAARRIDFAASVAVSEISLFESTLAPAGARYRRLHAAALAGDSRGGR